MINQFYYSDIFPNLKPREVRKVGSGGRQRSSGGRQRSSGGRQRSSGGSGGRNGPLCTPASWSLLIALSEFLGEMTQTESFP